MTDQTLKLEIINAFEGQPAAHTAMTSKMKDAKSG